MTFKQREQAHILALMLLAFAIPLGEGIALLGMGLVLLLCCLRRHSIDWTDLNRGLAGVWFYGWLAWFVIGVLMISISGLGVLKSSEIFRHAPILAAPAVFLSVRSLPQRALPKVHQILMVMLCAGALLGVYQWYSSSHDLAFMVRADSSIASQARVPGAYDSMAAAGFYFHRLKMAHVLVLAIGLVVPFALTKGRQAGWAWLAAALFTTCLAGTFAKASWGACLVGTIAAGYCLFKQIRKPLLFASLAGAGAILYLQSNEQLVLPSSMGSSTGIRSMIWGQALHVIQDYPGGVGLGNYSKVVASYYDQVMPAFHIRTYPHNLLLSWWAECGAGGMLILVSSWVITFVKAFQRACDTNLGSANRSIYASLVFYLASFWIIGLTHDVFYHQSVALMFFSGVGWLLGQLPRDELSNRP